MRIALALTAALACVALTCAVLAQNAWAQNAPPATVQQQTGATPQNPPPDAMQSIRVRTSEVTAPVTVRNRKGELVLDLSKKDFRLYDDGAQQKITHFDLGGQPFDIALVVQTSPRVQGLLPAVRKTGILFTQVVMGQTSRAAVIGFSGAVNVLQNFTPDQEAIQKTINGLTVGSGGAHLYDAMARGVSMLENQPAGRRRILLVIAEPLDSGSQSKLGEVLRSAHVGNVTIYSIALSITEADLTQPPAYTGPAPIGPPGTFPVPIRPGMPVNPDIESQYEEPPANLGALAVWLVRTGKNVVTRNSLEVSATSTGGLSLGPRKDRAIQHDMDEIGGELHAQYTLAYQPPSGEKPGYHTIRVTVDRPDVHVRTRPGYYIAPPVH
ncbi:MAG TPA: VWA domain-containing protein [Candidatus Dormibacteraeota bacterium]|nr:VWA domain-containing protein [Candidatus Dormibacteraeota bacterium]